MRGVAPFKARIYDVYKAKSTIYGMRDRATILDLLHLNKIVIDYINNEILLFVCSPEDTEERILVYDENN